jgi:hypothetical protein
LKERKEKRRENPGKEMGKRENQGGGDKSMKKLFIKSTNPCPKNYSSKAEREKRENLEDEGST